MEAFWRGKHQPPNYVVTSSSNLSKISFDISGIDSSGRILIAAQAIPPERQSEYGGPLYLGGLKACDKESCIINSAHAFYEANDTTSEHHLKPYDFRPPPGNYPLFSVFFCLSWKSVWRAIILFLLCTLASLLPIFKVVPSSIFPFDTFGIGHLFILVTLCMSAYFSIDLTKYRAIMDGYFVTMGGNCKVLASTLCASLYQTDSLMKQTIRFDYRGDTSNSEVILGDTKILCLITDCWFIIKSIMYASNSAFSFGDVDYKTHIQQLPMPSELLRELSHNTTSHTDIVNPLISMLNQRINTLSDNHVIAEIIASTLLTLSYNVSLGYSEVNFLVHGGSNVPRFVSTFFSVLLWVYCVSLSFPLYGYFATDYSLWVYYLIMFTLILMLSLSFDLLFNVFANPFSMFQLINKSPCVIFEPTKAADDTARFVDRQFDLSIKQQIAISLRSLSSNENKKTEDM